MLDSILGTQLTLSVFLACTAASLLLGVGVALVSTFRSRSTPGFAVTLAILPAVVQLVIMLVNGNLAPAWPSPGPSAWCASAPPPAPPGRSPACSCPWP